MKKRFITKAMISCCLLSLLLIPGLSFAGAWTAPKGQTYNRVALNSYYSDAMFDSSGETESMSDNKEFSDRNISYYMEHGLLDQLTLIFSTSYKFLESEDDTQKVKHYSFSDIDLGLRYRILEGRYGVLSLQGLIKIPEAYDESETISPGNGQYDATIKLQYGRSLYPVIPGYFNLEAGYRLRDEEPADEFLYLVEFGVDITKKIYGRIKYDVTLGMDNSDTDSNTGSNPSFSIDYDLAKVDLAFGYKLTDKWAVELETLKEISGESVSKGITYTMAVSFIH